LRVARPRVSAAVLLLCGLLGWCGPVLAAERAAPGLGLTVVLVADCAADPEACATMRAALAQLEKVPRRHRALAAPGTRALAAALEDLGAPGVLGVLEIASAAPAGAARSPEGSPPAGARAGLELARGAGRRELTPAWLVDAVLRAGATTGLAPVVEPATAPWGQLVARLSRPAVPAAADAALAAGVPAIRLLVPPGRDAAAWVGATVRRLEGLGERPRPETEYFALSGRVWTRPALYWLGGPLWVALVIAGRPGVWRRTTADGGAAAATCGPCPCGCSSWPLSSGLRCSPCRSSDRPRRPPSGPEAPWRGGSFAGSSPWPPRRSSWRRLERPSRPATCCSVAPGRPHSSSP
jgi:hypothetical protein